MRELKMYDRKVHRASLEMAKAMSTELRHLGVPFFGQTMSNPNSAAYQEGDDDDDDDVTRQKKRTKLAEAREMVQLQRRMLELLEDMCNG